MSKFKVGDKVKFKSDRINSLRFNSHKLDSMLDKVLIVKEIKGRTLWVFPEELSYLDAWSESRFEKATFKDICNKVINNE